MSGVFVAPFVWVVLINICDGCSSGCKRVIREGRTCYSHNILPGINWLSSTRLCRKKAFVRDCGAQLFPYFRDFRETYFDVFNPFLPLKWINSWMWQGIHSSAPDLSPASHTQPKKESRRYFLVFLCWFLQMLSTHVDIDLTVDNVPH